MGIGLLDEAVVDEPEAATGRLVGSVLSPSFETGREGEKDVGLYAWSDEAEEQRVCGLPGPAGPAGAVWRGLQASSATGRWIGWEASLRRSREDDGSLS